MQFPAFLLVKIVIVIPWKTLKKDEGGMRKQENLD